MANMFGGAVGYKASTISISQEVLQRLGQIANGNVMIQMQTHPHVSDPMGAAYGARFYCMKCKDQQNLDMDIVLNEDHLLKAMDWCKAHKHEEPKPLPKIGKSNEDLLVEPERNVKIVS